MKINHYKAKNFRRIIMKIEHKVLKLVELENGEISLVVNFTNFYLKKISTLYLFEIQNSPYSG